MNIICLGGGPAGLYFAISMKLHDPSHTVTVLERNRHDDTFGWGVVLSKETLDNLRANDAVSADSIEQNFAYWDDLATLYRGARLVTSGQAYSGIGRKKLLVVLQERARELGVDLQFETAFASPADYQQNYDLVIGCDGINSPTRTYYEQHFQPNIQTRLCKFVWLGTKQKFDDAFTFIFEQTEKGWIWAHAYQFDADTATFIIECSEQTWENYGFGKKSQSQTSEICEQIFAQYLGGHQLVSNANHIRGSAWLNFPRILCQNWVHENIALMGDAAATAHFSIGSGTKLAMESAIALARYLHQESDRPAAFALYQKERRDSVLRLQSAARNSTRWFENIERCLDFDPIQFNYALLTRSQRIGHENLRIRDPKAVEIAERYFQEKSGIKNTQTLPPIFTPYRLREITVRNRIVVAPLLQYKAVDGCVNDWHFSHYAERAKGGAGLIITEMTAVNAHGRISDQCPGLYHDEQMAQWQRIVDFVHCETEAKIGCQLGHAGGKAATCEGAENENIPLAEASLPADGWPLLAASAVAWSPQNRLPRAMAADDMARIIEDFTAAAKRAAQIGFDMLSLYACHGGLLSSFITPLLNRREDGYGGSLENRMRFPLEIFKAVRAAWPAGKPIAVRISADDWMGAAGIQEQDAVEIAKMLKTAGADMCDVSSGGTSPDAKPLYGRMFQTPLSDAIRNEARIPTMAAGNISDGDQANAIILSGRADLLALGRQHLVNPYWTLHQAVRHNIQGQSWPQPYQIGVAQLQHLWQAKKLERK